MHPTQELKTRIKNLRTQKNQLTNELNQLKQKLEFKQSIQNQQNISEKVSASQMDEPVAVN